MKGIVFDAQKKKFLPIDKAAVPIMDIAFQRSAGVFETLLVYDGKPFHLGDHLKRLHVSARLLGIKEHFSNTLIEEKIKIGVKKVSESVISVKVIITGGDSTYLSFEHSPRLYILFTKPLLDIPEDYKKGVALITTPLLRTLPTVKSLNYLGAVISYQKVLRKKCYDAIYATKDHVLEGTTFNFAIIIRDNIIVPEDGVLDGITMQTAMRLAKKLQLNIFRKKITFKELRRADEAFLTSSYSEILPVIKIDDIKIGNGRPGAYSKKLLELYRQETGYGK